MPDSSTENALRLAELSPLRAEINATLDRMNNNENFCAGACVAVLAFSLSHIPSLISILAMPLAILLTVFGFARYRLLRSHVHQVDKYVAEIEKSFSAQGGWTLWLERNPNQHRFAGYSETRLTFWVFLFLLSVGYSLFVVFYLLRKS